MNLARLGPVFDHDLRGFNLAGRSPVFRKHDDAGFRIIAFECSKRFSPLGIKVRATSQSSISDHGCRFIGNICKPYCGGNDAGFILLACVNERDERFVNIATLFWVCRPFFGDRFGGRIAGARPLTWCFWIRRLGAIGFSLMHCEKHQKSEHVPSPLPVSTLHVISCVARQIPGEGIGVPPSTGAARATRPSVGAVFLWSGAQRAPSGAPFPVGGTPIEARPATRLASGVGRIYRSSPCPI